MDKKGDLNIESMVKATLIVGLFLVSNWFLFVAVADKYSVPVDQEYAEVFEQANITLNETTNVIIDVSNNTKGADATTGESLLSFASSGINSLLIVFNSFTIFQNLVTVLAAKMAIPPLFTVTLIALALFSMVMAIVAALLRTGGSV